MYLQSAKAYFGVWIADDWPSLRQIVVGQTRWLILRRLIALGRHTNLGEVEPAPLATAPARPQA